MSLVSLREYQETTVQYGVKNPYCILALSPGLGKTLIALEIANRTKSKVLVVCPAYLIHNWVSEIKKFFPDKSCTYFKGKKDFYNVWDTEIVITSYGLLQHCEYLFEWADMVIADECQNLKSVQAKRTDLFHKLIYENSVERCLLLTGTPIKNRVYELYSLIAICNYRPQLKDSPFLNRFPTYVSFADYFSIPVEKRINTKWGTKKLISWNGYRNIPELKEKYLRDIYIRFSAEEVLTELPDKVYKNILIEDISCPELVEAFNSFNEEHSKTAPDIKAQIALAKAKFTVEYVKDLLETEDKVVVYSDHVLAAEEIAKQLGATAITGSVPIESRKRISENFVYGETRVLVATIGSFSTGVTLIVANNMVFNDYPWIPGDLEQAEGRIARIGQKNICVYHRILGSIQDEYILNVVEEKTSTIKAVT